MRFGVCGSPDESSAILEAGFDYIEVSASGFESTEANRYKGLPVEATNGFFAQGMKLFGPDRTPYLPYGRRVIEAAASLGAKVMVIGSGTARNSPSGAEGEAEFCEIVSGLAEIANQVGVELAPESLNRTETNVGNDLGVLATELQVRGVGYTADVFHVLFEWDAQGRRHGLGTLFERQLPFCPTHVHIANLSRTGLDGLDEMLVAFADRLRTLGFDRGVSLECVRGPDFDLALARRELGALFG